jgi:hypothetical protein
LLRDAALIAREPADLVGDKAAEALRSPGRNRRGQHRCGPTGSGGRGGKRKAALGGAGFGGKSFVFIALALGGGIRQALLLRLSGTRGVFLLAQFGKAALLTRPGLGLAFFVVCTLGGLSPLVLITPALRGDFRQALLLGLRRTRSFFLLASLGQAALLASPGLCDALFLLGALGGLSALVLIAPALGGDFRKPLLLGLCRTRGFVLLAGLGHTPLLTGARFRHAPLLLGLLGGKPALILLALALGSGIGGAFGLFPLPKFGNTPLLQRAGFGNPPFLVGTLGRKPAFVILALALGRCFGEALPLRLGGTFGLFLLAKLCETSFLPHPCFGLAPVLLGALGRQLALFFLSLELRLALGLTDAFRGDLRRAGGHLAFDRAQFACGLGLPIELLALKPGLDSLLARNRRLAPTLKPPILHGWRDSLRAGLLRSRRRGTALHLVQEHVRLCRGTVPERSDSDRCPRHKCADR